MKKVEKYLRVFTCLAAVIILFGVVPVSAAENTVGVKIPVVCEGENTDEALSYHLNAETSDFQKVAVDFLRLRDGETDCFSVLYTYPGTYHYTITQGKGTDRKTTYDETAYMVDVYVTEDENGQLSAEPIIYLKGSNEKKESAKFKNIKKVEESKVTSNVKTVEESKVTSNVKTGDMFGNTLFVSGLGIGTALMGFIILRKNRKEDI